MEDYLYDECSRLKWKSKRYMEDNGTGEDITTYSYDRQGRQTGFITDGWDNLTEIDGNGMVARRLM